MCSVSSSCSSSSYMLSCTFLRAEFSFSIMKKNFALLYRALIEDVVFHVPVTDNKTKSACITALPIHCMNFLLFFCLCPFCFKQFIFKTCLEHYKPTF